MKTKELIKKCHLENGIGKKSLEYFYDLLKLETLEEYRKFGEKDSATHFDAAVKITLSKWNSISNKIPGTGFTEGMWKYFYATRLAPMKEDLCPTWKARNDELRKKWEEKYGEGNDD